MTKNEVERIIKIYAEAWVKQDPNLILTIFTPDATYNDPHEPEAVGHGGIRKYWVSKVIGEQKDIKFKLLNLYVDGDTAIAEWEASFFNIIKKENTTIKEATILEFEGDKIKSLREYWHSKHS